MNILPLLISNIFWLIVYIWRMYKMIELIEKKDKTIVLIEETYHRDIKYLQDKLKNNT